MMVSCLINSHSAFQDITIISLHATGYCLLVP
jgi:hypothetical protein